MNIGLLGISTTGVYYCDELTRQWRDHHHVMSSVLHNDYRLTNDLSAIPEEQTVYIENFDKPGNVDLTRSDVREWVQERRHRNQLATMFDGLFLLDRSPTGEVTCDFGSVDCLVVTFHFGEAMGGILPEAIANWLHERRDIPVIGVGVLPPSTETYVRNTDSALDPVVDALDHCVLFDLKTVGGRLIQLGDFQAHDDGSIDGIKLAKRAASRVGRALEPWMATAETASDVERYAHGDVSVVTSGATDVSTEQSGFLSRFTGTDDEPTEAEARTAAEKAVRAAVSNVPTVDLSPDTAYRIVLTLSGPDDHIACLRPEQLLSTFMTALESQFQCDYSEDRIEVRFVETPAETLVASLYYQDVRKVENIMKIRRQSEQLSGTDDTEESSSEAELSDL